MLITCENVCFGYDDKRILENVSFTVNEGERIGLIGGNGEGKTTLLKLLTRDLLPDEGRILTKSNLKIGYLEQDLVFPDPENNAMAHFNARFPRYDTKKTRAALAATGIKNDLATKPISALSGGEQVRIKLTVLCHTESNLLILDEPTNHLDVRAKAALKKALLAYPGAIILVSHEKDFAGEICDRVFDVRM